MMKMMSAEQMAKMDRTLEARLARAVSVRLADAPVSFVRWVRDPATYADYPVFGVPGRLVGEAGALGFKAWQFEVTK